MSNYLGRKSDFTPGIYTRYFERTETSKSSNDHIYFNEDNEQTSSNYQIKRDILFKRLFPSKYADDKTEMEQIDQNRNNNSVNNTAQALGDFIPLSNNSSTLKKEQSSTLSDGDIILSSSDEYEEDLFNEAKLPTSRHESIVGHLHSRSTIENVRTILIRELYQRTSDSHTEWLKCKMEIPKEYINPKYHADFQRRYRKDIKRNSIKTNKSMSMKNTTENGYHVHDLTTTDETAIQINNTLDNDDVIETSSRKLMRKISSSSPIRLSNDSPKQSQSIPEYIILDSNDEDNLDQGDNSSYFIDRSSSSFTAILQPTVISTEDYNKEDSKYAQLPSRNTIIRPILSKHQRRKQSTSKDPPKPLVSAIDRIIDHMDQSDTLNNSSTMEQQNLLIKQIKKRKKKKKNKIINSTVN